MGWPWSSKNENLKITGIYGSAEEAIENINASVPDVMLVGIHLPRMSGIELISILKAEYPSVQFLICTSYEDDEKVFNGLKAGASGYILKKSVEKLAESIIEVYNGGSPMSSQIARKVVSSFQPTKPSAQFEMLSQREKEVLEYLSKGYRYKEIAEKLFLSIETIRTHIRNIYGKLQVNSRTEALNKIYKIG